MEVSESYRTSTAASRQAEAVARGGSSFIQNLLAKVKSISKPGLYEPLTWAFWRNLVVCFCIFNIVGHWLEVPYCTLMDSFFGIVDPEYAVWNDPWYHPYWVYGSGAVVMTLLIEPFKEHFLKARKTKVGAILETFAFAVIIAMIMELLIGLMVNQPDEFGVYPYWDNSQLPLNIFGQAWLVNDVFIGLVAVLYVWVLYPLICRGFNKLSPKVANTLFGIVVAGFTGACFAAYLPDFL